MKYRVREERMTRWGHPRVPAAVVHCSSVVNEMDTLRSVLNTWGTGSLVDIGTYLRDWSCEEDLGLSEINFFLEVGKLLEVGKPLLVWINLILHVIRMLAAAYYCITLYTVYCLSIIINYQHLPILIYYVLRRNDPPWYYWVIWMHWQTLLWNVKCQDINEINIWWW